MQRFWYEWLGIRKLACFARCWAIDVLWLLPKFCRESILNIFSDFRCLLFSRNEGQPSRLISEVSYGTLYSKQSDCVPYHWAGLRSWRFFSATPTPTSQFKKERLRLWLRLRAFNIDDSDSNSSLLKQTTTTPTPTPRFWNKELRLPHRFGSCYFASSNE